MRAEWVQQRILAWWMLAPFVLPVLAYAILYFLLAPAVDIHFDPAIPVAGQPVTVRWNPTHVSNLSLKVDGKAVPDVQNINPNTTPGHIFPTGLGASKEVEVEISNRFSFFRKVKKAQPVSSIQPTATPTVVPDTPIIDSFDANTLQVLPGGKVVLKWKAEKVEAGGLTISTVNGDTFPNLPNEGTQEVQVTGDTTYVLTAVNKGGQPVMKSVRIATSPAQATANAQTAVVQSATARVDATNAAQATTAANTSSTAAAGSASAATAAANAQAGTQAAGQSTTAANQTSAVNTQGASQTSAVNTVSASQTAGVNTAVAGQTSQQQTTIAGNNAAAAAQTSAAGAQTCHGYRDDTNVHECDRRRIHIERGEDAGRECYPDREPHRDRRCRDCRSEDTDRPGHQGGCQCNREGIRDYAGCLDGQSGEDFFLDREQRHGAAHLSYRRCDEYSDIEHPD